MQHLPAEIVHEICGYLHPQHFLNFRKSCTRFYYETTNHMTTLVHVQIDMLTSKSCYKQALLSALKSGTYRNGDFKINHKFRRTMIFNVLDSFCNAMTGTNNKIDRRNIPDVSELVDAVRMFPSSDVLEICAKSILLCEKDLNHFEKINRLWESHSLEPNTQYPRAVKDLFITAILISRFEFALELVKNCESPSQSQLRLIIPPSDLHSLFEETICVCINNGNLESFIWLCNLSDSRNAPILSEPLLKQLAIICSGKNCHLRFLDYLF
ncbi:hypothetical protein HK098_002955 [Nowakowskiella sp. JEL0407]|nr:hypothetical protein HK098_002955 [Nowakowskiella sp. JEL0407]